MILSYSRTVSRTMLFAVVVGSFVLRSTIANAAVTVSVPSTTTGQPGYNVQIPVSVTGTPETVGFFVELTYDNAILHYVSSSNGSLTSGWNMQTNAQTGRVSFAGINAIPLQGTGTLAVPTFQVDPGAQDGARLLLHFL